jgi:cytochrome c oxidase subunit 3
VTSGGATVEGLQHAVRLRPLTFKTHPLVFGVVVFLASELMFFAGFFAAYFDLRAQSAVWPPPGVHLNIVESSVGTLLLALSSFAVFAGIRALRKNHFGAARRYVAASVAMGIAFLAIALHGWSHNGFRIDSHAYGSLFYAMTGFHALHVLAGILLLIALLAGLTKSAFNANGRAGAEAIGFYWHFVFIVWVGIWGAIYLIR